MTRFIFLGCAFLSCAVCFFSCSGGDNAKTFSGIGTVELNDSVSAIHYYASCLDANNGDFGSDICDGARVGFSCKGSVGPQDADGNTHYSCNFSFVSEDLLRPILSVDSAVVANDSLLALAKSKEGFYAQNLHITRDWKRNDFFDATVTYFGSDGVGDFLSFVRDSTDADEIPGERVVLWLRLSRASKDSSAFITKSVSASVNCLRDSTKERIRIRLKRFNNDGDTVVNDYIYSYINFIE